MAQDLYVRNRRESHFRYKRLLLISLMAALVIASIALVLISQRQHAAEAKLKAFNAAIARQSFSEAIELYREVQARAIQPADENDQVNLYREVLDDMEGSIDLHLQAIEKNLNEGRPLDAEAKGFAAGMGEVTGLRLSRFTRELCSQYLNGGVDLATLESAINQLKDLDNLKDSIRSLDAQLPQMQALRPAIMSTEQLLADKQWYPAHAAWLTLAEQDDSGTFVQDYARQRLDDCKSAMYEPLLTIALDYLEQHRAVTAESLLLELEPIFPNDSKIKAALATCKSLIPAKLVTYRGAVEHLTLKPLIVDPGVAFDGDNFAQAAQDTMLTTAEFKSVLEQLYANNFILVDQSRQLQVEGDYFGIDLPEGKKPVVLVLEGLNYYVTRRLTGNCWNLALNDRQQVCGQYPDTNGNLTVSRDAEAIGILDAFVEAHPDFSFDGAKGLITLTGYEGIFGYVTDQDQLDDRNQALQNYGFPALQMAAEDFAANREQVAAIIQALRRTGWQFGSSTYGFINVATASPELVADDWAKWLSQVGQLTGPVNVLEFPNGALLQMSDARSLYYQEQGIRIFGGLGATPYITRSGENVYVDKVQISGYSLTHPDMYRLSRLFDADAVLDRQARKMP